MKKLIRLSGKIVLIFVGILLAYGLIGTGLSLIPVNGMAASGNDVVIYLDNNGVHTDIVVPTRTARFDWSAVVRPREARANRAEAYLAFGWGSHYSPLFTCNTWANAALKSCRQKCCLWTALQQPIFWKYK